MSSGLVGPANLATTRTCCVMRDPRHIVTAAVLALYLAQILGGGAVHSWQCCEGGGAFCSSLSCSPGGDTRAKCGHSNCQHHSTDAGNDGTRSQDEGGGNHDPSDCAVCQVLGQAQDTPVNIEPPIGLTVSTAENVARREFFPVPPPLPFQSRGPPSFDA